MRIKGVIDSMYTKDIPKKNGNGVMKVHYAMVDNNPVNLGFKTNYQEGVFFDEEVDFKYGEYQLPRSMAPATKVQSMVSPTGPVASTPSLPKQATAFPVPINTKDTSIIRQNALTNARELVVGMMNNGMMMGKSKQELMEEIIQTAYFFADFSSGRREQKLAEDKLAYMNLAGTLDTNVKAD